MMCMLPFKKKYCAPTPVISTGMEHPKNRIFLSLNLDVICQSNKEVESSGCKDNRQKV